MISIVSKAFLSQLKGLSQDPLYLGIWLSYQQE